MKNFLNKLAWISSLALWIWTMNIFWYSEIELIIVWIFIWVIIKSLFLNNYDLERAVESLKIIESKKENKENKEEKDIYLENKIEKTEIKKEIKPEINNIYEENLKNLTEEEFTEEVNFVKNTYASEKVKQKQEKRNDLLTKINDFFKTNFLAKVWAIMIFIWVFFLLSIIWENIPDFFKLIILSSIWIGTYFAWIFLDKKNYKWEWKILIWAWILINFLVILGFRYLLFEKLDTNIKVFFTFSALILNSILWIYSWLKYKSQTLIFFSFILAYINPLLLWTNSENPYTLLIYTTIVTIGSVFVAKKYDYKILLFISFFFANLLYILAPASNEIEYYLKYLCSIITIFVFINFELEDFVSKYIWKNMILFYYFALILPLSLHYVQNDYTVSQNIYILNSINAISIFLYFLYKIKTQNKEKIIYLASIFSIAIIIFLNFSLKNYMIFAWISFINICLIFYTIFNKKVLEKENSMNYLSSIVSVWFVNILATLWAFYIIWNDYLLWKNYLALIFFIFSIIYWLWIFVIAKITNFKSLKNYEYKNILAVFFALFLSFLNIWFLIYFWQSKDYFIPIIFLLESSIIYLLFKISEEKRFLIYGDILNFLWIVFTLIFYGNFGYLEKEILVFIILILQIISVFLLKNKETKNSDYLNIIWISFWLILFYNSFYDLDLIYAIFIFIIWIFIIFFEFIWKEIFKKYSLFLLFASMIFITVNYENIQENLRILNGFLSYIIFLWVVYYLNFKNFSEKIIVNSWFWIFSLIFLTILIYDFTKEILFITIFWWIVWTFFIIYWIQKNEILKRTIWLYLISLICLKIFLYDIWLGWTVTWIIMLIILWVILILVSITYTKKIWNDLWKEFSFENIFWKIISENKNTEKTLKIEENKDETIENILKTDVSKINTIIFYMWWKEFFRTKRKNILQIVKYISDKKWKTVFEPNELKNYFEKISKDYKSELDFKTRKQVENFFKKIVENWWEIKFE